MAVSGRRYAVEFHAVAVTAAQDVFYIKPAADKPVFIEAVYLGVVGGSADAGDAQEELLDVRMIRVPATVTASSAGNSFTPNPLVTSDTAAGFTARINDTTIATSSGTILVLHSDAWNSRAPYVWCPPEEHRHQVANAQAWVCRLTTVVADSVSVNGTCIVAEVC